MFIIYQHFFLNLGELDLSKALKEIRNIKLSIFCYVNSLLLSES